jgi:hypothetical protein
MLHPVGMSPPPPIGRSVAGMRAICGCALALALLAGCGGESAEEKAQSSVCDARADIQKQVDELDGLTAATVTVDGVKGNLDAISNDLKTIKDAQGDLSGDRKDEVDKAWQSFSGEVKGISSDLITSLSAADAKQQLATSFDTLAASFRSTFEPIDCSDG